MGSTPGDSASSRYTKETHYDTSPEYEGESSLFAHAIFARRFLQNAINNTPDTKITHDMEIVLENLRLALDTGRGHSNTTGGLYPHARELQTDSALRDLPVPPIDKIFACLRMAKEIPQVSMQWLGDYIRPAQFNDYLVKVMSPGPSTEADLVIVHCGLYWLFCECHKVVTSGELKVDYSTQASECMANLETVLVNLRFHQPTNMDSAYAMGMAVSFLSAYCESESALN